MIQVPIGKTLIFDESVQKKLHQGEFLVLRNGRGRIKGMEWKDIMRNYEAGVEYVMTPGGELKRTDGKPEDMPIQDEVEPVSAPHLPMTPTSPTPVRSASRRSIAPSPLNTLLWG